MNKKKVKVSICIPAYNRVKVLERLLDSILIQKYKDYEVIISDDSRNNFVKKLIFSKYKDKFNLLYYKNEIALGSPANWNKAIKKSRGDFIKIMHHDDYFLDETALGKFVNVLENNPKIDFVFCAFSYFDEMKKKIIKTDYINEIVKIKKNPLKLIEGNYIGTPSTTMYRRKVKEFFDEKLIWYVDIEFYLRLIKKNNNFYYIEENLAVCTVGSKKQISVNCVNDKKINIVELIYVYMLYKNTNKANFKIAVKKIAKIINNFEVFSVQQIYDLGVAKMPEELIRELEKMFFLKKIKNNIKKWLLKLIKQ